MHTLAAVGFAGEVGVPCGEEPSSAGGEAGDRMKPASPSPTRAWSSTEGTWTSAEGIYSGVAASVGDYSASALPARGLDQHVHANATSS